MICESRWSRKKGRRCRALFGFAQPWELYTPEDAERLFARSLEQGQAYVRRFGLHRGDVLELGRGYGGMLLALEQAGARAVGIDPDERRVAEARSRGLDARVAFAEALPFPDACFDAVISGGVIEHLPDRRRKCVA